MDSYHYAEVAAPAGAPLLIVLHGTGGDENDLIELGRSLMPDAHIISPRGDVSEGGALRFFRRAGMGVYDMADLARATGKMAAFLEERATALKPSSVTTLGYSNGANLLAGVLFSSPSLIDRAVLMHPLIPFVPPIQPGLAGRRVLITAGRRDEISPPSTTEALARYFIGQKTDIEVAWHEGGHELRREEVAAVKTFLG
jgi:phospholipase/carboxylesterase